MRSILIRTLSGAVFVASIMIPIIYHSIVYQWIIAIYAFLVLTEFIRLMRKASSGSDIPRIRLYLLMVLTVIVWIIIPFIVMAMLPVLSDNKIEGADGVAVTLSLFALVWIHDTFAYLSGLAFGKRKLIPSISPAKTVEGAIGGIVFTFVGALLIKFAFLPDTPFMFWLGGVAVLIIFANLGDLSESKLKRLADVKDSGRGMPGHGGFFDRFDALITTAPAWLLWVLIMG